MSFFCKECLTVFEKFNQVEVYSNGDPDCEKIELQDSCPNKDCALIYTDTEETFIEVSDSQAVFLNKIIPLFRAYWGTNNVDMNNRWFASDLFEIIDDSYQR